MPLLPIKKEKRTEKKYLVVAEVSFLHSFPWPRALHRLLLLLFYGPHSPLMVAPMMKTKTEAKNLERYWGYSTFTLSVTTVLDSSCVLESTPFLSRSSLASAKADRCSLPPKPIFSKGNNVKSCSNWVWLIRSKKESDYQIANFWDIFMYCRCLWRHVERFLRCTTKLLPTLNFYSFGANCKETLEIGFVKLLKWLLDGVISVSQSSPLHLDRLHNNNATLLTQVCVEFISSAWFFLSFKTRLDWILSSCFFWSLFTQNSSCDHFGWP